MKESTDNFNSTRRHFYEALLVLGFVLLCGFNLLHHPMWRDELLPWIFARDSASIPDLLHNMRYEAQPRLWYLLLYGVVRLVHDPVAIQATHLLIIGSAVALFVRFCPLPFYIKALTVFGYFFVYEYGTISRNYALGVLLCFAFCARFSKREKGYLGLAAILFLASQADQFAGLIAGGLGGLLILEALMKPEARDRVRAHKVDAALSFLLIYGGVLLGFWSGIPASDKTNAFFSLGFDPEKILHAFGAIWDGFVPFPEPSLLNAWGWGMTGHAVFGPLACHAILGMILFPVTVSFFRRSRLMLWSYLGGAGLLLLLAFVQGNSYARHAGHFFIWFIICLWLAHYFPISGGLRPSASKTGKKSRGRLQGIKPEVSGGRPFELSRFQKLFVCSLLIVHIFDSAFLSIAGYSNPFSCSKAAALYLEQHDLKKIPILGYPDYTAMPVSGYANVPIYYADHRWGTFIIDNNKRRTNLNPNEVMDFINEFAAQGHQDFIVLLNRPFMIRREGQIYVPAQVGNLHMEASFYPCMVGDESYWIYRYKG